MNVGQLGWQKWHNKSYTGNVNGNIPKINRNQGVDCMKYKTYCSNYRYKNHKHINTNADIKMTQWWNNLCAGEI